MSTCVTMSSGALQNCIGTGSYPHYQYPTSSAVSPDGRSVFIADYSGYIASCLLMGSELVDCITAFDFNSLSAYYPDTIVFVGNVAYVSINSNKQVSTFLHILCRLLQRFC